MTPTLSIEIPAQENLLQKYKEESGKASTTRSIDEDLYWCRIPDNSWSRTILHDKAHWRVLTICRASDMSWVYFTKRWKSTDRKVGFEGTSKLHPCWKSQPVTCKVNMEWKLELNLWTKTILTRGSESLMDWTSWLQTWSTKSTTTKSRKHLKRRRKYLRWRRKHLLLQADQRPKQNRQDLPLLVHLEGLHLFLKEHALILDQELNSIKRTQWQNN